MPGCWDICNQEGSGGFCSPRKGAVEPTYTVCDLFQSIQGEGTWTGRPMQFVRFWGCPLSCPWCDEPLHRRAEACRTYTLSGLLAALADGPVLLTGGEPLLQPHLPELIEALRAEGRWVAMETSGVGSDTLPAVDWLTLSPKTALPEGWYVAADEIKYVVGAQPSDEEVAALMARARCHPRVWLQPLAKGGTPDPLAMAACYQLVMAGAGRLRLSLQVHKWLGVA